MTRAPWESEMAPSLSKRGQSVMKPLSSVGQLAGMVADFVFVGVLTYYLKRCAPCGGRHPPIRVHGPFASHSLLLG